MLLLPTPVRQTAHGYSPELCKRSRPVPQIMTFVFPAFTLNPFFSMASFHIKSLLTHSYRESAMMTRSSAYRSSQGTPAQNSHDKFSSTMMKSKGLSTDPWWTPTFTSFGQYIWFGSKLYRQIVGIPMGTYCAPLVADLFVLCYERDFMLSLSDNNQTDIIEAFNSISRYLEDLLNFDNFYFDQMVGQIYLT